MTTAREAIFAPGPRRSVALGGSLLLIGLAVVGTGHSDAGAAMSLGGLALLVFGVHSFGRSGEDDPSGEPDAELED